MRVDPAVRLRERALLTLPRFDPSGFIMEHYVDGDLLNMTEPTHVNDENNAHLHVWGELARKKPPLRTNRSTDTCRRTRGSPDLFAVRCDHSDCGPHGRCGCPDACPSGGDPKGVTSC